MKASHTKTVCAALLAVALGFVTTPLEAGPIGISATGQVISIDTTTGLGTIIGASGVTNTLSLATSLTGTMYTVDIVGSVNRLDTIDPTTGAATLGPTLTGLVAGTVVNGLAFSSTDVLFAEGIRPGGAMDLYTIDVTTGAATLIGAMSATQTGDLAFSPTGTLYAWNISATNGGLMTVDTTTGAGTFVTPGFSGLNIFGLTFDGGSLLGAGTSLFGINTATSALTLIGPIGFDVRGMAMAPVAVPEPSSLILTLTAASFVRLAARRRRKTRE